jgi:hypothetical protein
MGKLFVTLFAPPGRGFVATLLNFCSCTQDKFVMLYASGPFAPLRTGTRICPQLKSSTVTHFWFRDSLYRDTAPVLPTKILYRDSLLAPIKLVPRSLQCAIKFVPRRQKHMPYPPCTVTLRSAQGFWLKYQDPTWCLRRVSQPPHIAGPLAVSLYISICYTLT